MAVAFSNKSVLRRLASARAAADLPLLAGDAAPRNHRLVCGVACRSRSLFSLLASRKSPIMPTRLGATCPVRVDAQCGRKSGKVDMGLTMVLGQDAAEWFLDSRSWEKRLQATAAAVFLFPVSMCRLSLTQAFTPCAGSARHPGHGPFSSHAASGLWSSQSRVSPQQTTWPGREGRAGQAGQGRGGQRVEGREGRGQRAVGRGQRARAEGRGQRAAGQQGSRAAGQRAEGRGQRAEGRGQRAEGRGQRAEGRGQRQGRAGQGAGQGRGQGQGQAPISTHCPKTLNPKPRSLIPTEAQKLETQ